MSQRLFQRRLPLKDNDLLFVFLAIDINFLFVSHISQPFFRGIPKYMRGSSFSLSCKFRSSVSGDFDHVFSRFHFSPVTSISNTTLRYILAFPINFISV